MDVPARHDECNEFGRLPLVCRWCVLFWAGSGRGGEVSKWEWGRYHSPLLPQFSLLLLAIDGGICRHLVSPAPGVVLTT